MEKFWCALDVCFGLAGEAERRELYSLHRPGAQAGKSVLEFAQHVALLYESLQHMSEVTAEAAKDIFVTGLNNEATRQRAKSYRSDHRGVSLRELGTQLFSFEEALLREKQTAMQANVFAGLPAGAVRAVKASHPTHPGSTATSSASLAVLLRLQLASASRVGALLPLPPASRA